MAPQHESRTKKSLLNARVNLVFYFLALCLSFFSRKIFLDNLGAEFIGLTGTLQNLLGFLNLADLGIGGSIAYVLYKPLYNRDEQKLREIVSVLGFLYTRVGAVIAVGGVVMSAFLPMIFSDAEIETGVIYAVFFGFLTSSLIGYFINYRQTVLSADQRGYVVAGYSQTATICKTIIQMVVATYWCNFYIWIAIELSFSILHSIILNYKINKTYPWLRCSLKLGKEKLAENKIILKNARNVFVHQIAGMGRNQLLPFLIYAYSSLSVVAYYGNYTVLISRLVALFDNFLGSTGAGVGNLIAQGDIKRIKHVYWELQSVRIAIAGFVFYSLYVLISPFIQIWLGDEYILPEHIVMLALINTFFMQIRGTTEQFNYGYGLFYDVWAPIVTLAITVGVAVVAGNYLGLAGVLLGNCSSSVLILHIWKPYMLFVKGFKTSYWEYWRSQLVLFGLFAAAFVVAEIVRAWLRLQAPTNYFDWVIFSSITCAIYIVIYATLQLVFFRPTRTFVKRFKIFRWIPS